MASQKVAHRATVSLARFYQDKQVTVILGTIRPQIDANLLDVPDSESAANYIAYLEAAFRDEHGVWLEETYRRHGRSPRFAAKCVRRFGRWLIAMRAYAARQESFHYYIEHLSVTLHLPGHGKPLALIEVTQRTGIAYPEG